jgi:hypothetical protein
MTSTTSEWLVLIRPRLAGFEVIGDTYPQPIRTEPADNGSTAAAEGILAKTHFEMMNL